MKSIFKIVISVLVCISCNSSSVQNQSAKTSNDSTTNPSSSVSNDNVRNSYVTACDSLYVGTWESENITRDDDVDIKDPKAKTYLRITKPDEYYRVELKSRKEDEYKPLGNLFTTLYGRCALIIQTEKVESVENVLMYNEETHKLKFESRPYSMGYPENGVISIVYHRFK